MKLSVIITTYNSETWLEKVLFGYSVQTEQEFEIIIADDGSTQKTRSVIDALQHLFKHKIIHVWQEDNGFQKSRILNKAILKANTNYLLFTDGDCIPRKDFIEHHLKHQEKGYFLSGGYFKLPASISNSITENDIVSQKCFTKNWLIKNGLKYSFKLTKLTKSSLFARFMNWITPTKKTWNGHNASGYKDDILAVNGFNEDMQYGGMDREFGERLFNNGVLSKQIRYSAICVHLYHDRGYANAQFWKNNNEIRAYNKQNNITYIEKGISLLNDN